MVTPRTVDEFMASITAWTTFQAASFSATLDIQAALLRATNTMFLTALGGRTVPVREMKVTIPAPRDPVTAFPPHQQLVVKIIGKPARPLAPDPVHSDDWVTSALAFRPPFGMAAASFADDED